LLTALICSSKGSDCDEGLPHKLKNTTSNLVSGWTNPVQHSSSPQWYRFSQAVVETAQ